MNASRDYITVLCPVTKDKISQNMSEVPVHQKKEKLRTAKNIIDKIEWDENIDKKEFRVGYLDKFTGVLEISFEELLVSTEIKEYRIEYFRRNGEIVWSKKDRVDILWFDNIFVILVWDCWSFWVSSFISESVKGFCIFSMREWGDSNAVVSKMQIKNKCK